MAFLLNAISGIGTTIGEGLSSLGGKTGGGFNLGNAIGGINKLDGMLGGQKNNSLTNDKDIVNYWQDLLKNQQNPNVAAMPENRKYRFTYDPLLGATNNATSPWVFR